MVPCNKRTEERKVGHMLNLCRTSSNTHDFIDALPFVDAKTLRKLPPQLRRQMERQLNRMPDLATLQAALPNAPRISGRRKLFIGLTMLAVAVAVGVGAYLFLKDDEDDFDFELDL